MSEPTSAAAPAHDVDCEQHTAGLAVPNVPAAVDFYTKKLGFHEGFLWGNPPTFAGVEFGHTQIFLQEGTPCPQGCFVYFMVDDADALLAFHQSNGIEIHHPIGDREYGIRDYTIRDLHGHYLTFGHPIFHAGPKTKIERVDVPVRLEKRLAALLEDLAQYKRLSLNSLLEEILLHTNEPLGDGVASPHTKRQLAYIQELKKKHGIDYDSHASYGWEEE